MYGKQFVTIAVFSCLIYILIANDNRHHWHEWRYVYAASNFSVQNLIGGAFDAGPPPEFAHLYPDVMEKVSADDLAGLAASLLRPPPMLDLSHVTPIRYSMAEALDAIRGRLEQVRTAPFRDLVADCDERIEVVVRFLALLELYRDGKVELAQAATFGEIEVRWEGAA